MGYVAKPAVWQQFGFCSLYRAQSWKGIALFFDEPLMNPLT